MALEDLEEENNRLRAQLQAMRDMHNLQDKALQTLQRWQERCEHARYQQDEAFAELQAVLQQKSHSQLLLKNMRQWTTLDNIFNISTQGAFATINGMRLGAEAMITETFENHCNNVASSQYPTANNTMMMTTTTMASSTALASHPYVNGAGQHHSHSHHHPQQVVPMTQSEMFLTRSVSTDSFGSLAQNSINGGNNGNNTNNNNTGTTTTTISVKVPWSEINSALGQLALLLSILEESLIKYSATKQQRANNNDTPTTWKYSHEILCMGSSSKMGIRKNPSGGAVTYYNLFSDDSFQFFGRRNFNTALQCLVQCVKDAADYIQRQDPTIVVPHAMEIVGGQQQQQPPQLTVGGLRVTYTASNTAASSSNTTQQQQHSDDGPAVEWTRAMKYLLTNVKHLLLFRPFHL